VTHDDPSAASTVRGKVSTGYGRLDEALQGGFFAGSAILLSSPASSEVPILVSSFLESSKEASLLICRSQSSAEAVSRADDGNLKCLICSEKPISPSKNMLPGKGIDNLTELNFQITETISSVQPKRIVLEILSDILLRHKALQTRRWLNELLEKLRSRDITTLAVLNPYMHADEEVQALVDLFDGNLEMIERDVEGQLQKFLRIKWIHRVEAAGKELPLLDLTAEGFGNIQPPVVVVTPIKEPRWLTPLVGRAVEISRLKTAFEKALANRSSVVALQGEAGVGKTRLMQELAVYAQSKRSTALTGNASEGGLPYAPWIEIARQYIGQAPGELLRRILGPYLSEFARLVPDIAVKLGTIPPSKPLGEQQDKIRLYEAVTQFFISISSESPLLMLFDDMQSADQSSLELLEYFVRSTSNFRVLTACSYRSEDIQSGSPLYQTLMKFNRQRLLETIQVKNLSKEETTELVKQMFGEQTVSHEFGDLVYQRTGGNPFFVEEVLRSLVEDGIVFRTEKKWDRKPIQEIVLPESVKSVLKSRLTRLQPETMNLLTMASVIGPEFDFEVLREVTQTQEDALLERLEESITAGLISEVPNRKDVFKFADNRIRELLLGDLIRSRRVRYHVRIAEAMEKAYSKNLENLAETIATHFSEGVDIERTVKYSLMAGDRNRAIHAYDQAIKNYGRALDLIDLDGNKEKEKEPLLRKLAECHVFAGQLGNAIQAYQKELAILEQLNDRKGCARVCLALARTYLRAETGRVAQGFTEATQVLMKGLNYLREEPESFEEASIYGLLAQLDGIMDKWDEALTWAEKAREAGNKTGNYFAVSEALAMKGSFLTDTGKIDEGLPLWQQALEMAVKHDEYDLTCYFLSNLEVYTYPRSLAKAREFAVRHYEYRKHANDIMGEAGALASLSHVDFLMGDWARALEEEKAAVEIVEKLGLASNMEAAQSVEGWTWLMMGDLQKAEAHFQNASRLLKEGSKITDTVGVHLGLALLMLEHGREDEAKAHLERCVNAFRSWEYTTEPISHIETLLHLTSISAKGKEIEKAREFSQWAKRLAETLKSDAGLAMACQAEASLLLASDDRKGAEEAYLKALDLWEKAGWPYYHAKALVAYSEAVAPTNPDESKKRLQQAAEIFSKLGAKWELEKAEAKLSAQA
jgi:predicted ATPase/KaiC/GvpD/RAD55 family RecA-like ATPase